MKLDWDLVREVMTEIEEMTVAEKNRSEFQADYDEDTPEATKARHVFLLHEAGFVKGTRSDTQNSKALLVPELTWEGQQLLATIRSKGIWERVKNTAKEKGLALSFDVVKVAGKMALEQLLKGGDSDPGLTA